MARLTKKAEQSEATRGKLLKVAERLFASRGYAATPIEEIVQKANVTRGALYHHFEDKQAVFRGVYDQVQKELAERIVASVAKEPRQELHLEVGCEAFLDACLDKSVQRIVLLDGPSVLGWDAWHEADANQSLGMIKAGVQTAMDAGYIQRQPVEPLAWLLFGAMNEAGLGIARSSDPEATRREMGEAIDRLIAGLRAR